MVPWARHGAGHTRDFDDTIAWLATTLELLGPARCAEITHVSADAAARIARRRGVLPQAVRCAHPFHVVKWATEALDQVRRQTWNVLRRQPGGSGRDRRGRRASTGPAQHLKRARWALWKNPENLTGRQRHKLAWIAKTEPRLHRAYLLKEGLRHVFAAPAHDAKQALQRWLSWAARSPIPEFVKLGRTIRAERETIHASLDHGLSNALIESTNTKIRLLTRIAFGFKHPDALISLALLPLGGYRPALPDRTPT